MFSSQHVNYNKKDNIILIFLVAFEVVLVYNLLYQLFSDIKLSINNLIHYS